MYDTMPIEIAASGMETQRIRIGAIASNLANALSTRRPDGDGPYQRRMVRVEAKPVTTYTDVLENALRDSQAIGKGEQPRYSEWLAEKHLRGVGVKAIERDDSVRLEYDEHHPDRDMETNIVAYPNISISAEMADMITASRLYEGNVAVIKNTKDMIMQLFDLLRK